MLKVNYLGLAYSMEALTNVFVRVPLISKKKYIPLSRTVQMHDWKKN